MNKLAEQLSNDIAVRAAQKLAALVDDNGMEKEAGKLDAVKKMLAKGGDALKGAISSRMANPSLAKNMGIGALAGAGIGGLGGAAHTALTADDPTLSEILKGGLLGAGVGGGIGAGVGGAVTGGANGMVGNPVADINAGLPFFDYAGQGMDDAVNAAKKTALNDLLNNIAAAQ